jgi:hypothetical protein
MENQEKAMERVNAFPTEKLKISEFRESVKGDYHGKICPTCNRLAKEKKVKLNKSLCLSLLHVLKYYRYCPDDISYLDYFNLQELFFDNNHLVKNFPKLEYWDLIEAKGELVDGVFIKEKNMWRISENGIKYAQREIAVPVYAITYDGIVEGHQLQPYATIDEILEIDDNAYNELIDSNFLIE